MNRLNIADRTRVVAALVEGNSIRATCRMTGVSKPTVLKLLADLGKACATYHDEHVRQVPSKRVQCDEIWSFVGAKQKNVTEGQMETGCGDVWTWTALDADSKLMVSWLVGQRGAAWAKAFMEDVASRVATRIQITTDGHKVYGEAVEGAFGMDCDYAMLIKLYGQSSFDTRYSPGECIGTQTAVMSGNPDPRHISTSFVERQNLTMRMSMRRFTRLTNAFSKKIENHEAAIALHFMHYNFCRVHSTLRVTPAMEAGLSDHVWSIEELVKLLEPKSILDGLTQVA
ncbi:IS1 family transposase [Tunturiibacter gelidiferens]|uniref:IS1 family transposase n=1 Tax=Tunturiibacter gelidiferens TaxID=3069689 RepID=A0AAU7Z6V6_9BACT